MISFRRFLAAALGAGLVVAGAGCGSASPSAASVQFATKAVTTGDTTPVSYGDALKIDRSEFDKELKALVDNKQLQLQSGGNGLSGAGKKTVDPRLAAGWLTAVIYDKLITHEFDRRHLKVTADDTDAAKSQLATQFGKAEVADAFPTWFQKRLVDRNARAVAVRGALSGLDFSEASLHKYFDAHKDEFGQNCVSHILVKTKPEADAVLARLKAGEDFAAVAKAVSIDTGSGTKGGDLGCNPKGVFVPEFDTAASELPIGQLSDPVQTQYGFHIILVKERKPATFDSAREQAKAALNAESQGAFRQFLQEAVTTAKVTVDRRYGTFEPPGTNQPPEVIPPKAPKPNTERTDNVPTTQPLPGEPPGSPDSPVQKIGG
ncbi:MAG: peptidyl-prolyl cis-trans isomerase [Actinomycetota bacterium]|jgi:parvulin-like peptidyl-prolyl isomerase|nr:peptidyl-prolyl cis-trans isomerase [Actinomycetota bacterium]MDQ1503231.1 peptidyl-prolyl cis-trans isomerase [Actinomycetota bacterium]